MTKQQLESCVTDVRDWMAANMLKLNDSKTEYIVIGSKHTLDQFSEELKCVEVGGESIAMTTSARNIGVYMDSTLRMEEQVASIYRANCYVVIRDIGRILQYLT